MLVELQIARGGSCQIRLHPYEQSRGFHGLKALSADEQQAFFHELEQRSRLLSQPAEYQKEWKCIVLESMDMLLAIALGLQD